MKNTIKDFFKRAAIRNPLKIYAATSLVAFATSFAIMPKAEDAFALGFMVSFFIGMAANQAQLMSLDVGRTTLFHDNQKFFGTHAEKLSYERLAKKITRYRKKYHAENSPKKRKSWLNKAQACADKQIFILEGMVSEKAVKQLNEETPFRIRRSTPHTRRVSAN